MSNIEPLATEKTYLATLLLYHEEEVMGEAYFNALAERSSDDSARSKLRLLARVERHAAESVRPLLEKYGLTPRADEELVRLGMEGVERDSALSWSEMVQRMATEYTNYMPYFEALERIAPTADLPALQTLTAHETITIEFARQERLGNANASQILEDYIAGRPGIAD